MTVPERFYQFMEHMQLRPRWVEKACGLSNGYLGKQRKNKGSFGGTILRKIEKQFPELNMTWLLSGEGIMLNTKYREVNSNFLTTVEENFISYAPINNEMVQLLKKQVIQLEASLQDKQKLIDMLEKQITDPNS